MLIFFRRLRQGILDSGATKKYLLYAVGEILLVMIGILLALQVNRWNQHRVENKLERTYLESFLSDLHTDSICIERNRFILIEEKKPGLEIIDRLLGRDPSCCEESIRTAIEYSAYLGWAIVNERSKATFDDIISSGNLRLITNSHLRAAILGYYSFWDHAYERQDQRKSNYANLTYKLFGDEEGDDAEWFHRTLNNNQDLLEFTREFTHEKRFTRFLENVTLHHLSLRCHYLKNLIQLELNNEYDRMASLPNEEWVE